MDERILTAISDAELERRWRLARGAMAGLRLDALVMQNHNDWIGGYVKWFTDMPATNGYPRAVAFYRGEAMVVVEQGPIGGRRKVEGGDPYYRGVAQALTTSPFSSIGYTASYDAEMIAADLLAKKCARVGLVAPGGMFHGFASHLKSRLAGSAEVVDATDAIDRIKAVKSAEELNLLRACAAMQDQVFAKVAAAIRPGMRDNDVTALAQYEGQLLGSEQGIFLGSSNPLGEPARFMGRHVQNRTLRPGDQFTLLIENNGPSGFYTEIGRTLVLGKASNRLVDAFEAMKEAQANTLRHLTPGASSRDIFADHNAFMRARGLPEETRLYAHGQGYDMVERPLIRDDEPMEIEAAMCLAVHPGYDDGVVWAVICDNYIVHKERAPEPIHMTEKKIFEIR